LAFWQSSNHFAKARRKAPLLYRIATLVFLLLGGDGRFGCSALLDISGFKNISLMSAGSRKWRNLHATAPSSASSLPHPTSNCAYPDDENEQQHKPDNTTPEQRERVLPTRTAGGEP